MNEKENKDMKIDFEYGQGTRSFRISEKDTNSRT